MKVLTIPNILTCIRLFLMPVFLWVYFAPIENAKYIAMGVLAFSFITDVLDGFIARKFNMISNIGKVLDPIADKLMQVSVLVCIAFGRAKLVWVVAFLLVKEILIGIGALALYRKHKKLLSSNWFGKVSCFISILASLILVFAEITVAVEWTCVAFIVVVNIVAFISYLIVYIRQTKSR